MLRGTKLYIPTQIYIIKKIYGKLKKKKYINSCNETESV